MKCKRCKALAEVKLPSHHTGFCRECFFVFFERQVARAVKEHAMFRRGERILAALSGGKDSLALARELKRQGHDVTGLHVYLGIPGSSDAALEVVRGFCEQESIELRVASAPDEGLSIPKVKERFNRPVCSSCGKIKRHLFNRAAREGGFDVLATGHNLDDECARLLANTLRWDTAYLGDQGPVLAATEGFARKVKPLYRLSEYETACYSFLTGIDYSSEPCPYSPGASFTGHKSLLEDLEEKSPGAKLSFYESFLKNARQLLAAGGTPDAALAPCRRCSSPTTREFCGVCVMKTALAEDQATG